MRYPASEKLEIIRLVEEGHLSARQTLAKLGIPRTTFYRWYDRYLQRGEAGLQDQSPKPKHVWNRIPDEVRRKVIKLALMETDFTYLKVLGWSWFYLSTILDDYSQYIISTARQGIAQQCPERDGSSVRTCGRRMSPTHWNWRCRLQAVIRSTSYISLDCSATTAPATSLVISLNGYKTRE